MTSRPTKPNGSFSERSEEHTSELQSQSNLVCRLLLEKKKKQSSSYITARIHSPFLKCYIWTHLSSDIPDSIRLRFNLLSSYPVTSRRDYVHRHTYTDS